MRKTRIKRPIYKWIQLDSQLEYDIFKAFDDKIIHTLPLEGSNSSWLKPRSGIMLGLI